VTDALQALGGYGYMDEYGLSKRLRDVTALRVLHGGPDQLLLARNDLGATS
jgi:alkylation response protein AidB-like acyl-CoA dehydrogenase